MKYTELPIYQEKNKILDGLKTHQVIVVESPTGSGKTTQLPIILNEAGFSSKGRIGITQPRRIAAVSVCEYICKQKDAVIGGLAGYKMRFEDKTTPETEIKIMTDGILLQELKHDDMLSEYSVLIVDEAHERSLNIDFILGLLKRILEKRPELKVIISSATINAEIFSQYFNSCPVIYIDAKMYPVAITYDAPDPKLRDEGMLLKIRDIVSRSLDNGYEGDILIFLSGEKQIKDCISTLKQTKYQKDMWILPLFGRLSKEEQERVFIPPAKGKTKVVVSTNIAETSVTIDGITMMIDSGKAKVNNYNPRTYTSALIEQPISKASCNQRKGRAGRTRPGKCYRLYSKNDFDERPLFPTEEIYRTDLSEVVLRMSELGIYDFEYFDFISPPGKGNILSAIETLELLDALNEDRSLSNIGKEMAEFPLMPRLSRIIIEAIHHYPDVIWETLVAASFLSSKTPFILPPEQEMEARRAHHAFNDVDGDFVSYLKLYKRFKSSRDKEDFCKSYYLDLKSMHEIDNIVQQFEEILSAKGIPITSGGSVENYLCSVSRGLIQFVCIRSGRNIYRSLTAERIQIHPGSVMFQERPKFMVSGEIVRTSRMFARSCSPLQKRWLKKISPVLENLFDPRSGIPLKSAKKQNKDTTNQLYIGSTSFKLTQYKGNKKMAILPWDKVKTVIKQHSNEDFSHLKKLRGTLIYNKYELLSNEKVPRIFQTARYVNPETDIINSWPQGKTYNAEKHTSELCNQLDAVLFLITKKANSKKLFFLSLQTDYTGHFWFKPTKKFFTALNDSFASLEDLIDRVYERTGKEEQEIINKTYRRLSSMFSEDM